jgi:hypothetical protein
LLVSFVSRSSSLGYGAKVLGNIVKLSGGISQKSSPFWLHTSLLDTSLLDLNPLLDASLLDLTRMSAYGYPVPGPTHASSALSRSPQPCRTHTSPEVSLSALWLDDVGPGWWLKPAGDGFQSVLTAKIKREKEVFTQQ